MTKRLPFAVLVIAGVAILLSALVWAFFSVQIRHEKEDAVRAQARHNANLVTIFSEHALRTVEDVDGLLLDMRRAYTREEGAGRPEDVPTPFSLSQSLVYRGILDASGMVVAGPAQPEPVSMAERAYFKTQKTNRADTLVMGQAVVGRISGRPTVHISRRIQKPDGAFGGVVVVGLDPTIFTSLYQKVDMGASGHVAFVGFDGQTRARRLGSVNSFGDDSSASPNLQKVLAERHHTPRGEMQVKSGVDGVERIFSFITLPSLSMVVIVGTSSAEALAAAVSRAQRYMAIATGATFLFLTLAALLSVTFMRQRRHTQQIERLNASLEQRVEARTSDLKQANQRLATFSYSVSHDLRGPLSTIDGFSGLLQRRKSLQADEGSLALVKRIRSGVSQMTQLVDGLLTLATISREQITRESVNLSELARALIQRHAQADPQRNVEVHVQDHLVVQADSRLMHSVMANLVGNAWKFTGRTALPRIEVGSQTDAAGELTYFVRDNGAGFDMANVDKLFQVFERLHSSSQFEGTGIGLATVKQVIKMHGGDVWAEAAAGAGATFYFRLSGTPEPS